MTPNFRFISIPRVPPPFNFPSPSFCCHPVLLPPPSTAPPKTLSFFRSIIHAAVTVGIKGPWRSLRQPRSRSSRTGWWETGSPPRSGRVCVHVCVSESGYSSGRSTYDMWRMSRDGAVVSQNDYRKFIENKKRIKLKKTKLILNNINLQILKLRKWNYYIMNLIIFWKFF